jgi:hypothetical protein
MLNYASFPVFTLCYYTGERSKATTNQELESYTSHADGKSRSNPRLAFLEGCKTKWWKYSSVGLTEKSPLGV